VTKFEEASKMLDQCLYLAKRGENLLPFQNPLLASVCRDIAEGVYAANERIRRYHSDSTGTDQEFDIIIDALLAVSETLKALNNSMTVPF
jgi:hypothetical protein